MKRVIQIKITKLILIQKNRHGTIRTTVCYHVVSRKYGNITQSVILKTMTLARNEMPVTLLISYLFFCKLLTLTGKINLLHINSNSLIRIHLLQVRQPAESNVDYTHTVVTLRLYTRILSHLTTLSKIEHFFKKSGASPTLKSRALFLFPETRY